MCVDSVPITYDSFGIRLVHFISEIGLVNEPLRYASRNCAIATSIYGTALFIIGIDYRGHHCKAFTVYNACEASLRQTIMF